MASLFRASLLSLLAAQVPSSRAHVQMDWPYPLRSPYNPAVPENLKDYDMASPLKTDGSNFPCKNYQTVTTNAQAYDITAVYQAGGTYNISLIGGATHMGGSCQISLSYDNGATFKVIESMIGGCPLTSHYDFTIPEFAPSSSTVLLSWSWFNLIGNQNMYQNCARVQVVGGTPSAVSNRRSEARYRSRRQTSLDSLPDMFVCDVGNGCTTIEKRQVVFPNPGSVVVYGEDSTTPDPGPGFTLTTSGNTTANTTISTTELAQSTTLTTTASSTQSTLPIFQNTTSALGGVFVEASTTSASLTSTTTTTSLISTSLSSVSGSNYSFPTTLQTRASSTSSLSLTTASSTPYFGNLTTTSSTVTANSSSSSVLASSTSTSLLSSSTTSTALSPSVVTVTVTVTATPPTTSGASILAGSLTEVLTIVPISELSVLQSQATSSAVVV